MKYDDIYKKANELRARSILSPEDTEEVIAVYIKYSIENRKESEIIEQWKRMLIDINLKRKAQYEWLMHKHERTMSDVIQDWLWKLGL